MPCCYISFNVLAFAPKSVTWPPCIKPVKYHVTEALACFEILTFVCTEGKFTFFQIQMYIEIVFSIYNQALCPYWL